MSLKALLRRIYTPRWYLRLSQVSIYLRDIIVAIKQTRLWTCSLLEQTWYCEMPSYLLLQLVCIQRPLGNYRNIPYHCYLGKYKEYAGKWLSRNTGKRKNWHLWAGKEHWADFRLQIERGSYAFKILEVFLMVLVSILYFYSLYY